MGIPVTFCFIFVSLHASFRVNTYNIAKVQNIRWIASSLKFFWYESMEWNIEDNFNMEWNMEWKIFGMEWNRMEETCQYGIWKNHLPLHSIPWPGEMWSNGIKIAFFPKNYEKSPSSLGLHPQTPTVSGGWGLRSQAPSVTRLNYSTLLYSNTSPNLDIFAF